jgi:2-phosphoglycerate kinase
VPGNIEDQGAAAQVILIGGAPLSGKTAAARLIGQRCGMPVISTDHLGEAARAVTTPSSNPDLHACTLIDHREYYASNLPERLFDDTLRAHRALWPAIEAVIRRHLQWAGPAVIEGWALLPHLVVTIASARLCAVWIEAPEAMMRLRLQAEADFVRGASDPSLLVERFLSRSAHMNEWLRAQASARGLPYVVLSGSESPHDESSLCLEAVGLTQSAAEHCASGDAPRAARS